MNETTDISQLSSAALLRCVMRDLMLDIAHTIGRGAVTGSLIGLLGLVAFAVISRAVQGGNAYALITSWPALFATAGIGAALAILLIRGRPDGTASYEPTRTALRAA